MLGDERAIKYARRDLVTLEQATFLAPGNREVVQAGGNLGVFAEWLSPRFKSVYTFEPDPRIFRLLARNMTHQSNVVLMQAALGYDRNFVSTATVHRRKPEAQVHDGVTHVNGRGLVPTLRIDDFGFRALDMLVLDLEGYEMHALMGAQETIERCHPLVMVEVCENCEYEGFLEDDIRTFLRMRGYELQLRQHSDEVWKWGK